MCGVVAYFDDHGVNQALLNKMRDTMTHRGPNDFGTFISEDGKFGLAHRRLSIIDLSTNGKQPMCNEDKTIWLSFNGEIYNFRELRDQLEKKGHQFISQSDSETVIHAYEEWGEECPQKLWGMYAFVIWDEDKNLMFGARDRLGVKPFHYFHSGDIFICASEIKAIMESPRVPRALDRSALCDFLTYRYIPSPKTIWKHVRKLPPGNAFVYHKGKLRLWRYWTLKTDERLISKADAADQLEELIFDAVKRRLVSDVPLGLFLSGGLDSAAIAWVMEKQIKEICSLTVGFKGSIQDETESAKSVAHQFNFHHHIEYFTEIQLHHLEELMWYFDEPFGASSMLPTFLLSRVASRKLTVALSGDGGDEAFGGYNWYDSLLKTVMRNGRVDFHDRFDLAERYHRVTTPRFTRKELEKLFVIPLNDVETDELWFFRQGINPSLSGIKQLQWLDASTFLPEEVLTKVDRASMANSIEVRSPFLDHRIFEFSFSLSDKVYFNGVKKLLLKKILKGIVPEKIINKPKQGFSAPIRRYLNDEQVGYVLLHSKAVEDGLFDLGFIRSLVCNPESNVLFPKRWLLLIFELWYRQWAVSVTE